MRKPKTLFDRRIAVERGPADVRSTALLRLGYAKKTEEPEGKALLEAALDDEAKEVRRVAFHIAVGARPRLAGRLTKVDEPMEKALSELAKKGAFSDVSPEGMLNDEDRQPLFAALASRNTDTALFGARSLALLGDPRATGALLRAATEMREDGSFTWLSDVAGSSQVDALLGRWAGK